MSFTKDIAAYFKGDALALQFIATQANWVSVWEKDKDVWVSYVPNSPYPYAISLGVGTKRVFIGKETLTNDYKMIDGSAITASFMSELAQNTGSVRHIKKEATDKHKYWAIQIPDFLCVNLQVKHSDGYFRKYNPDDVLLAPTLRGTPDLTRMRFMPISKYNAQTTEKPINKVTQQQVSTGKASVCKGNDKISIKPMRNNGGNYTQSIVVGNLQADVYAYTDGNYGADLYLVKGDQQGLISEVKYNAKNSTFSASIHADSSTDDATHSAKITTANGLSKWLDDAD